MREEQIPGLLPWNEVMSGTKLRLYKAKAESQPDVPDLKVAVPVNDRFRAAVDYPNYRLLKKSYGYEDDVV